MHGIRTFLLSGSATLALAVVSAGQAATAQPPHSFFATLAVTDDARRFVGEWERPGTHVDLHVASHVARGAMVTPFVIFKNCRLNAHGACDVAAQISMTGPDGKLMGPATVQIWNSAPLGPEIFMRARMAPSFKLAASAPVGAYQVAARVTDRISGESLTLTVPITYG